MIRKIFLYIAVKYCIIKAKRWHKLDGKRYYVLPTWNNWVKVINSVDLAKINKQRGKIRKLDINKLLKDAYYYTK